MGRYKKYYFLHYAIGVEEDLTHEFKGHRIIAHDELPASNQQLRTKQCVSRCLCAFLNSGNGGVVYLGVNDNGRVLSLNLSTYEMDHILLQVARAFIKFSPPVPNHLWRISFVPVVDDEGDELQRVEIIRNWRDLKPKDLKRFNPHVFPSTRRCWCELPQYKVNRRKYVVRIHIRPTKVKFCKAQNGDNSIFLPTIFQADDGNVYFRNQASVSTYSTEDIINHVRFIMNERYQPIVDKLKKELSTLLDK